MGPNEALLSHEHQKKTPVSVFQPGPGPAVGVKGGIETPEGIQIRHGRAYRLSKIEHSPDDSKIVVKPNIAVHTVIFESNRGILQRRCFPRALLELTRLNSSATLR
jgi:hypothetical protein